MARRPVNWKVQSRKARQLLGVSAPAFAKLLGVSLRTVRYWEAGEVVPGEDAICLMMQYVRMAERASAV